MLQHAPDPLEELQKCRSEGQPHLDTEKIG